MDKNYDWLTPVEAERYVMEHKKIHRTKQTIRNTMKRELAKDPQSERIRKWKIGEKGAFQYQVRVDLLCDWYGILLPEEEATLIKTDTNIKEGTVCSCEKEGEENETEFLKRLLTSRDEQIQELLQRLKEQNIVMVNQSHALLGPGPTVPTTKRGFFDRLLNRN